MTLRLDGLVIRGEIDNTHPYSVCGWLKIRGHRTPLTLNLTGDCGPTLKGMRVRFEDAIPLDDRLDGGLPDLSDVAWQQVGPTGQMQLSDLGGTTPRLSLEWFSQNGRVTLELPNPIVEPLDEEDDDDEDDDLALMEGYQVSGREDEDDEFGFEDEADEDPFGLFPDGLLDHLDEDAERLDSKLFGDSSDPPLLPPEIEMLEGLMEGGGVQISDVFDPPVRLPRAKSLNDEEVEIALKKLLARMAEIGISLEVCEHFTPRGAYELLLDEICPYQITHPDLNTHHWIQNFYTSDYCNACEAEFEREVEEFERNRPRDDDEDD